MQAKMIRQRMIKPMISMLILSPELGGVSPFLFADVLPVDAAVVVAAGPSQVAPVIAVGLVAIVDNEIAFVGRQLQPVERQFVARLRQIQIDGFQNLCRQAASRQVYGLNPSV